MFGIVLIPVNPTDFDGDPQRCSLNPFYQYFVYLMYGVGIQSIWQMQIDCVIQLRLENNCTGNSSRNRVYWLTL